MQQPAPPPQTDAHEVSLAREPQGLGRLPTVDLLGFRFHLVTEHECVAHVLGELAAGRGGWVVTPNLDILRLMTVTRGLWEWFQRADLIVADGMPIVWLSRALGVPLPERVSGSSLVSTLSAGAAREGRSLFLLGGDPGSAAAAAAELKRRHPAIRVAGAHCPPRGFERDREEVARIERMVTDARPDIVYVALGCPKQESLIARIRHCAPTAWYLGVGISFSYLAGTVRLAPPWVRRSGFEWVYRLVQDPRRLARRYLREDLPFALRLGTMAARSRLPRWLQPTGTALRLAPVPSVDRSPVD